MAKTAKKETGIVTFVPDRGYENPDGKTYHYGKIIRDNDDGTVDIVLQNQTVKTRVHLTSADTPLAKLPGFAIPGRVELVVED